MAMDETGEGSDVKTTELTIRLPALMRAPLRAVEALVGSMTRFRIDPELEVAAEVVSVVIASDEWWDLTLRVPAWVAEVLAERQLPDVFRVLHPEPRRSIS